MDRFDKIFNGGFPGLRALSRASLALGVLFILSVDLHAQVPPDERWRTLQTPHFRVTFPEGMEELARRAGIRGENAWRLLEERFVEGPSGKVDMVLTDHADISNGHSNVFPSNRIVIFAPPPVDDYTLSPMDEWLELVITHELVHIFHFDLARGPGHLVRSVFGRLPAPWPVFPGSATPGWTVEGVATYYESALTRAGRIRGSFHDMVLRTAVLEGAFESLNQASGDSPAWPGGQRYYVYGSLFLNHLLETHGEEAMGRFVEEVAGQWVPYRMNAAAKKAFNESFSEAWRSWQEDLELRYGKLREELLTRGPLTRGEMLTSEGFFVTSPAVSPSGDFLAFGRYDGRSDIQIRVMDLRNGTSRELTRANSLPSLDWTSRGDVVFSQLEYSDPYRIRGDLYRARENGDVTRLTRSRRLDHPDVAADGETAVAVQKGGGTTRLVLVDLVDGAIRPLTEFEPSTHWAYPRWSPDGRWIAAVRWQPGAYQDIVLLSREGKPVRAVTRDRAVDLTPSWSPDGRWLLWSSDRSGIPNLYAVEVDSETGATGPRRQITNVLGGASFPVVGPGGEWIYYAGYHHDGWHIQRLPMDPSAWFDPHPMDPDFAEDGGPVSLASGVPEPEGRYNPLATLRPTYWSPAYRTGDQAGGVQVLDPGWGLSTSGRDLVGRHSYHLLGLFSRGPGTFNGGASYSYAGFGNPVLNASFSQSHDADGPFLGPGDDPERLFVVERERNLTLGTTFTRRRARTITALGLFGGHVWEHRTLLDSELRESQNYRLTRPDTRFAEGRAAVSFGTARRQAFSISLEDGVGLFVQARGRWHLALADSLQGVEGEDRSYQELTGQATLYKSLPLPGFSHHALALRFSGGMARGSGADEYHFEVGGASGGSGPFSTFRLGEGLFFPVRGYPTASRYGRYAWSASAEYRFPLWFINGGPGLFPLHLDWISGTVFLDSGNAWGPELGMEPFENPRRGSLASVGGELTLRLMPFWYANMEMRGGMAVPLVEGDGPRFYLRLGPAF